MNETAGVPARDSAAPRQNPKAAHITPRWAVVIPAFQEEATIGGIVQACRALPEAPHVVVVDDGSTDRTAALAAASGAEVVRHRSNQGKGAALATGFARALAADAAGVATLDGDGQHQPADLSLLFACAALWPQRMIIGSRRAARHAMPPARYIANRIADFWVSWAAGSPIDDSQSGLRVYPAELLRQIHCGSMLSRGFGFESEILIVGGRLGFRTLAVPISPIYGRQLARRSHFRPFWDIARIVQMVAGYLLRSGMYTLGLWRSLAEPRAVICRQTLEDDLLAKAPFLSAPSEAAVLREKATGRSRKETHQEL